MNINDIDVTDVTDEMLNEYLAKEAAAYRAANKADAYCHKIDRMGWESRNTPLGQAFYRAATEAFRAARREADRYGYSL